MLAAVRKGKVEDLLGSPYGLYVQNTGRRFSHRRKPRSIEGASEKLAERLRATWGRRPRWRRAPTSDDALRDIEPADDDRQCHMKAAAGMASRASAAITAPVVQ